MNNLTQFDYVLYHSPCNDGFGGAYVAWLNNKDANFVGLNPRDGFPKDLMPKLENMRVIVIDIAFSRDIMLEMKRITSYLIVLDHHETSRENLQGLEFAIFDMTKSGCVMAWNYFFPYEPVPEFLEYIGLRDIWKHKGVPEALYFTTAFPGTHSFEAYDRYLRDPNLVKKTIEEGKLQYNDMMVEVKKIASTSSVHNWHNHKTYVVNATYPLLSEVGDFISERDPDCLVLLWSKKEEDTYYSYSIRTNSERGPNGIPIARLYGGGGHKNACGFKSDLSPDQLISKQ